MNSTGRMIMAALVWAGLAGCGDATGPTGGTGQVEVAAVGDASASSASRSPSESGTQTTSDDSDGTVHVRARVYLLADASQWLEVTNGAAAAASVSASGRDGTKVFASSGMQARSYTRVRVVFEEVRAEMSGGVQLVAGPTLTGEVYVEMDGGGRATVEREVDVRVRGGSTARLVIDLNSSAWMTLADAHSRAVSRSDFEGAVRAYLE